MGKGDIIVANGEEKNLNPHFKTHFFKLVFINAPILKLFVLMEDYSVSKFHINVYIEMLKNRIKLSLKL